MRAIHVTVLALGLASCQGSSATVPPATTVNTPPATAPAAGPPASPAPAPGGPPATPAPFTVAAIASMNPGARGWVRGLFLGWNGPCRNEPPTRSAWQLADSNAPGAPCVYVDGPMPPGVSPAGPPGQPVWVRVDAELAAAGPDRWLVARDVTREGP